MISALVHPFLYIVGILKKRKRIEDERKEKIKKKKGSKTIAALVKGNTNNVNPRCRPLYIPIV